MSLDTSIINKLKQLGDMMDNFISQRNHCNKTMKIMGIELEKLHVFITKLGLHVDRSVKNTDSHKKTIHDMIDSEQNTGGDIDESLITNMEEMNESIEEGITETLTERKRFDALFAKNLLKLANDPEITKQELKRDLKKMQRLYNAKHKKLNSATNLAVKALKKNTNDNSKSFKENNKEIIRNAVRQEKKKFLELLSEKIEKYEAQQNEDITNINEVWSELQKSIDELKVETSKPVFKKLDSVKKQHPVDELDEYIETAESDESLEKKLKTILEGGAIKLKKRKSGSNRTAKRKTKNKNKQRSKTLKAF